MIKKSSYFLLFTIAMFSIHAFSKEVQVIVIANSAPIYAEAHSESYKIETVKKGAVLTLFESGSEDINWLYVSYQSPRWRSKVTGFIQARLVEMLSEEKPTEKPKEEMREAKVEPEVKEKPPVKEEVVKEEKVVAAPKEVEKKEPEVEEIPALTSLPPYKKYSLTDTRASWENPRLFSLKVESRADTSVSRAKVVPIIKEKRKESAFEVREESVKVEEKVPLKPGKEIVIPKVEKEEEPQVKPQITPQEPPRPKITHPLGKPSWFTLSLGYGPSGGSGLGGFVQVNMKNGFSLHFGAGYYPTSYFYSEYDWVKDRLLYCVGVKYYLPFRTGNIRPYLDLQYGGVSIEAVRVVTGIWYYQYTYENIQKTLLGPTFLAGAEIKTGAIGLNVAFGLSYNTTKWDYWDRDYFLTGDIGLLVYF